MDRDLKMLCWLGVFALLYVMDALAGLIKAS